MPGDLAVTVTVGGRRSRRDRNAWYSLGFGAGGVLPPASPKVSGTAMRKEKATGTAPAEPVSVARTETVSPGRKGCDGTKLAPSPCE